MNEKNESTYFAIGLTFSIGILFLLGLVIYFLSQIDFDSTPPAVLSTNYPVTEMLRDEKGNLYEASFVLKISVHNNGIDDFSNDNFQVFRNAITDVFLNLTLENIRTEGVESIPRSILDRIEGRFAPQKLRDKTEAIPSIAGLEINSFRIDTPATKALKEAREAKNAADQALRESRRPRIFFMPSRYMGLSF